MRAGLDSFAAAALIGSCAVGFLPAVSMVRAPPRTGTSASVRFQVSANVISHCEVAAPNEIPPVVLRTAAIPQAFPVPLTSSCTSGIPPSVVLSAIPAAERRLAKHARQTHKDIAGHIVDLLTISY
jgi:hypothetical protein